MKQSCFVAFTKMSNKHPAALLIDEHPILAKALALSRTVQRFYTLWARSSRCDSAIPLALPGQIALGGAPIAMDEFDAHLDEYVVLHLDDGSSLFKRVGAKLPAPLQHLRQFESIGGLGLADVLAIDCEHKGLRRVMHAVSIIGVLYR